jgi:hypothetical protein
MSESLNVIDAHIDSFERGIAAERRRVLAIINDYTRRYLSEEAAAGRKDGKDSGYPPYHLMVVAEEINGWKR